MRILLVEDDELLGDGVRSGLIGYGHTVDWLTDGKQAQQALELEEFDAVILDLGLPRLSGLEILQTMRNKGNLTPVLILTARDALEDRVAGLDLGADDYLTKPFDLDELRARVAAIQRRSVARADTSIKYKDIVVDSKAYSVTQGDVPVNLSRREFALFQKLLENAGRALTREYLTQTLYGWDDEVDSNALEVHIHNLRKKFGTKLIRTIRGIGYMINKEEENQ